MGRALRRESFGNLDAVHGVHPGKILGYGASLVSLQAPDEMPGQLAPFESLDLGQAFLQEILAEVLDADSRGRVDCCGALALRNGQKRDGIDISGGCTTGLGHTTLSGLGALRAILRKG